MSDEAEYFPIRERQRKSALCFANPSVPSSYVIYHEVGFTCRPRKRFRVPSTEHNVTLKRFE